MTAFAVVALTLRVSASDWPQWRGPARDGHATPGAHVLESLSAEPRTVWRINVGEGHAGPIGTAGKVIYTDAESDTETVHALDAGTGKQLWKRSYGQLFGDEWGAGPRSTPMVDGDRLYVQSCRGDFWCLRLSDGEVVWKTSFERDFGVTFLGNKANEGTARRRGNTGSGLVDGDAVIVPVGGHEWRESGCFNKATGKVLWKSGEDEAAYSSIMVATLAGLKQVVAFNAEALTGTDRAPGRLLWRVPLKTNAKRHAATPVIADGHIVVNSHTFGMACFKISNPGEAWTANEAWINRDLKINLATSVRIGDYLYNQGPNKDFVCVDVRTGDLKWSRPVFGENYSSTIAIGNRLLVLSDAGELVLIAADPGKSIELGRVQVCGKTWSFPAYADGRLFVRDGKSLSCLDLRGAALSRGGAD